MTIDAEKLYRLLPAIHRLRDHDEGGPLKELIEIIAEQSAIVQEGIDQAYDDLFIETCAEWVVPYIGDLIGVRMLWGVPGKEASFSHRPQVANTLAHRRRKGTLAMLEQLARDVTNFPAVAVESFKLLATTQHMNHPRPENTGTVDVRRREQLERLNTPFDRVAHTFEARRIASGRGRYNIPNIGLFLFRLQPFPLTMTNARRFKDTDGFRYLFNPLGIDTPLFNKPQTEATLTQLAEPMHVPLPISRLAMESDKGQFYGRNAAVFLEIAGNPVPVDKVVICDLSDKDDGTDAWAHTRKETYGIDPVLGRIALPTDVPAPAPEAVRVSFRYGFSDAIGGGEYERPPDPEHPTTQEVLAGADLQAALAAAQNGGVIEINGSRTCSLTGGSGPNLHVNANRRVEVRAANGSRPVIELRGGPLVIDGAANAEVLLNGLVITGGTLQVTGSLKSLTMTDCTLVPGISRTRDNTPEQPGSPSLIVQSDTATVTIRRCITGGIRIANHSQAHIERSIVDATAKDAIAYAAPPPDEHRPGGVLTILNSTIVGRVQSQQLEASNTIFLADVPEGAPPGTPPVRAEQTQTGCVRFSFLPLLSHVPRRTRCHPAHAEEEARVSPIFTSLRFGTAGYGRLSPSCPPEIRHGTDDESEMGVFHDLYYSRRETNLLVRLEEYLRFGLEAGILYAD